MKFIIDMLEDITYCDRFECEIKTCPRHYDNRKDVKKDHSIANFEHLLWCFKNKGVKNGRIKKRD